MGVSAIKQGWLDFLVDQRFTHAVTFKPNDAHWSLSEAALHRLFVKVHMLVDRRLLGKRYSLPSRAHLRAAAIGVVEGLPNTGHLHGAFKVAPENATKFEHMFADGSDTRDRAGIWRQLCPSGTCMVERLTDPNGWHGYTFKHVWQTSDSDRIILLPLPVATITPTT